jgi:hypothetical protein
MDHHALEQKRSSFLRRREAFIIGSSLDGGKSKAKTKAACDEFAMIERAEDGLRRRNLII